MKNFPKDGHLQLADSFFLHQRCPLIGENTVYNFVVYCEKSVCCSHQGLSDVKDHSTGRTYILFEQVIKSNRTLSSFMRTDNRSNFLMEKIIRAKILHTSFIEQNNFSFLTAEHLSPLHSIDIYRYIDI